MAPVNSSAFGTGSQASRLTQSDFSWPVRPRGVWSQPVFPVPPPEVIHPALAGSGGGAVLKKPNFRFSFIARPHLSTAADSCPRSSSIRARWRLLGAQTQFFTESVVVDRETSFVRPRIYPRRHRSGTSRSGSLVVAERYRGAMPVISASCRRLWNPLQKDRRIASE
jgi:hypothetical protein